MNEREREGRRPRRLVYLAEHQPTGLPVGRHDIAVLEDQITILQ